jgi:hypothetical protein
MVVNSGYILEPTCGAFSNHSYQEPQYGDLNSETLGYQSCIGMFKEPPNQVFYMLWDYNLSEHSLSSGFKSQLCHFLVCGS